MISLRFLRALGLASMLVTVPKWAGVDGFQVTGAPPAPPCCCSAAAPRASTLVDSGGSLMCDASVGSDQSEGDALKIVVDECERIEPKYTLRAAGAAAAASVDVRAAAVVPDCCVTLEDVLGRGGGWWGEEPSLLSPSSSGARDEPNGPAIDGRLRFHAEVGFVAAGGVTATSGTTARARGAADAGVAPPVAERLEPRLWEAARSGWRRNVEVEDAAGLWGRATRADGRRAEKARWRDRSGEGAEKSPCELRALRGVDGWLGVSARVVASCSQTVCQTPE